MYEDEQWPIAVGVGVIADGRYVEGIGSGSIISAKCPRNQPSPTRENDYQRKGCIFRFARCEVMACKLT